jgi:phosphoribosylglycinamide formyltransferase-1
MSGPEAGGQGGSAGAGAAGRGADRDGNAAGMPASYRVVVLVSGSGSNLQALIDRLHGRVAGIEIVLVISNVPGVMGLTRAERAGIPTAVFRADDYRSREERDRAMGDAIEAVSADLIVGAGYMHILTPSFVQRFPHRIINLHPALLPSFPGHSAFQEAIDYGVKVTGVTVHFIDEGVDSGPVIAQEPVRVRDDDTADTLAERIHLVEHRVLPRVVELMARKKVTPPRAGSRLVRVEDEREPEYGRGLAVDASATG